MEDDEAECFYLFFTNYKITEKQHETVNINSFKEIIITVSTHKLAVKLISAASQARRR
jgi:hypothetical protein